ncbi:MAG: hypothetical protein JO091_09395 [Acidobacteriaceae bacterium]|nr:hypothetical protein [Acidobacteriaceae bacterium]
MSRRWKLAFGFLLGALCAFADDSALWREYGLLHTSTSKQNNLSITAYEMKDVTGAVAAWEWLRSPKGRPCTLAPFCTKDVDRTIVADDNYLVVFGGGVPAKKQVEAVYDTFPQKRDTSLPAILTFIPKQGLLPNSARYILGPASLQAFAPELAGTKLGFEQGAEAQIAEYKLDASTAPIHLAIFYYPTPEMARLHALNFKPVPDARVKRSGVLVAAVYGNATNAQAAALLSRVEYEAKVTWNDTPPPSPIKPLYQLLINILYLSVVLSGICLLAGLIYAGMRIYRRRYGSLEADEAMTTLRLTGD